MMQSRKYLPDSRVAGLKKKSIVSFKFVKIFLLPLVDFALPYSAWRPQLLPNETIPKVKILNIKLILYIGIYLIILNV
jgi:hypothetical protein